ncbi:hypothetical protein IPN41_03980 [Candidatus Falkowbacteria bacterium]|nr:MAG: hypothetical protein IPN41_03980 [Candidatus Falkowbacteria bacterium]
MLDPNLVTYIRQTLAEGIPRDKIRQELLKVGWDSTLVEEAFKSIDGLKTLNSGSGLVFSVSKFPHFIKWGLIGFGCLIIIGVAAWFFKDKLLNINIKEEKQAVETSQVEPAPFLFIDGTLKLFDFEEKFDQGNYYMLPSPDGRCFAIIFTEKINIDQLDYSDFETSDTLFKQYIWFNKQIVGPIRLVLDKGFESGINFSDDCTTIAFAAQKEDGLTYIYKNGQQINTTGIDMQRYSDFAFEPKTKKIFYKETDGGKAYIWIDEQKFGPYLSYFTELDPSSLKFSTDGLHYALKINEFNPEYIEFLQTRYASTLPEIPGFTIDKNLSFEDQKRQYLKKIDDLAFQDSLQTWSSEEFLNIQLDQMSNEEKLKKEFEKTSWVERKFLLVDGQPTEPFQIINDFHFTNKGELRYIARKSDGDYLFINNSLQKIESVVPEVPVRKVYSNFKSSPDGQKYMYSYADSESPVDLNLEEINNSLEYLLKEEGDESTANKVYFGVVNGKNVGSSTFEPSGNVIFSPDSKHIAYIASSKKDTYYVILDDKKFGPFSDFAKLGSSETWFFAFGSDNKLYFFSNDYSNESVVEDTGCLYINGEKLNCQKGNFSNFVFEGSSVAYIQKHLGKINVIFNTTTYGPYEKQQFDYQIPIISPDGNKVAYTQDNKLFLNGEYVGLRTPLDAVYWTFSPLRPFFTPDSQHIVYTNYLEDEKIEVRMNSILIELIDPQSLNVDPEKPLFYLTPSPDKKSVWLVYVDKSTKAMMIRNINLGL